MVSARRCSTRGRSTNVLTNLGSPTVLIRPRTRGAPLRAAKVGLARIRAALAEARRASDSWWLVDSWRVRWGPVGAPKQGLAQSLGEGRERGRGRRACPSSFGLSGSPRLPWRHGSSSTGDDGRAGLVAHMPVSARHRLLRSPTVFDFKCAPRFTKNEMTAHMESRTASQLSRGVLTHVRDAQGLLHTRSGSSPASRI